MSLITKVTVQLKDADKKLPKNKYHIDLDEYDKPTLVEIDSDDQSVKQLFDDYYGKENNEITNLNVLSKKHIELIEYVTISVMWSADGPRTKKNYIDDFKGFAYENDIDYQKVHFDDDDYAWPMLDITLLADDSNIDRFYCAYDGYQDDIYTLEDLFEQSDNFSIVEFHVVDDENE